MLNFQQDQADGLRRIMASNRPKVISVLSAMPKHLPGFMTDLAATISAQNADVLVVHAAQRTKAYLAQYGIKSLPALADLTPKRRDLAKAVKDSNYGFLFANLYASAAQAKAADVSEKIVNNTFEKLSNLFDVTLVDASLNKQHELPLDILNDHEALIQLSCDAESIKQGYALIKKVYQQTGRRSFGIIVSDATDEQAANAFRNISQVARSYMQVDLEFFGAIPKDEHLNRAAELGRTVTDAFPLAKAAKAFKAVAQRCNYKHQASTDIESVSLV